MTESIICAAIWYKNYTKPVHSVINMEEGIVLCGHRHGHIIGQMKSLTNQRTSRGVGGDCTDCTGKFIQGFLTSKNRFIDRMEAHSLFIKNGGIPEFDSMLYSEDLY